jgi:hypothetical protein
MKSKPTNLCGKEKRDQLLRRNLWRGDGEFQGRNNVRGACGLPPRGRYLTIRFEKSTAHRGDLLSGLQMKRILGTISCIRQLIRDSGSQQPILDSESKAAAISIRIPHVFSINFFPGQSGPLKGDSV